ncbi:hypothetical protein Tco_0313356 [Tanacetum coccineum]
MTRSSTKELFTPLENPKRVFHSKKRLFETPRLVESSSPEFDLFSDIEERLEEEATKIMTEIMEQYMSKTRRDYGSDVTRPKINTDTYFELKGQFLKELRDNTFSGSEHEDANEHIEKVIEIPLAQERTTWFNFNLGSPKIEVSKQILSPARTAKKMEEINNFQQEPDESFFRALERLKELLMKYPQHYLTDMQEVILFYNGLNVPTRQILDLKGAIPTKTAANAKAQLNYIGREIKKVNEKVYAAQFGAPYQPGREYRATGSGFYQRNNKNSSYPDRRQTMEELLTKFMAKSTKRHEENSNTIKEILASTDAAIRNQSASIKTLQIQIGEMSKVLQERGFGSLPSSTETNPRDNVKLISTAKADSTGICRI